MSGLLRSRVGHIEMINVGRESADSGSLLGSGIGLVRPSTEPTGIPQLARQVEPYADPRPGAVPTGRRHDVHEQGQAVGQPPLIADIHEEIAAGRADTSSLA